MANVTRAPKLKTAFWSSLRFLAERADGQTVNVRPGSGDDQTTLCDETFADHEDYTNANGTNLFDCANLTDGTTTLTAPRPITINKTSHGWFLLVIDTNSRHYLYKSVDEGANWGANSTAYDDWNPVCLVGEYAGAHSPYVTFLAGRGIAERYDGTLIMAEYNTFPDGSRTATSSPSTAGNNQAVVRISTDGGDTWSILWEKNTNGVAVGNSEWLRHFHCVRYDPYRDLFYFGIGDNSYNSGFVIWDPNFPWPANNATFAEWLATPGFSGIAGEHGIHNATDFIVLPNSDWVIHVTDGYGPGYTNGIYRFKPSNPRTFQQAYEFPYQERLGAVGARLNDGTLGVIEFSTDDNNVRIAYIYTSNHPDGKDWKRTGQLLLIDDSNSDTLSPVQFEVSNDGNRFIWVFNHGAAKLPTTGSVTRWGTVYLEVDKTPRLSGLAGIHDELDDETIGPVTLHPWYWVDSNGGGPTAKTGGNFYTEGNYPDYALTNIYGSIAGTGIAPGSTIEFANGHVETNGDRSVVVAAPTGTAVQGTQRLRFVGAGDKPADVQIRGSGSNYIHLLLNATALDQIYYENLSLLVGSTTIAPLQTDTGMPEGTIIARDCAIGYWDTSVNSSVRFHGQASLTSYNCTFTLPIAASSGNPILAASARVVKSHNDLFVGGVMGYFTNGNTTCELYNPTFESQFSYALNINSLPSGLVIVNPLFRKGTGSATTAVFANVAVPNVFEGICNAGYGTLAGGTGAADVTSALVATGDPATTPASRTAATRSDEATRDFRGKLRANATTPGCESYDGRIETGLGVTGSASSSSGNGFVQFLGG